jgi:protein TonB
MKNLKKQPTKQLEKFSNIFMQLGLVLVLFVVFVSLEHKTEERTLAEHTFISEPDRIFLDSSAEIIFNREVKVIPKTEIIKASPFIFDAPIEKGGKEDIETIIDLPSEDLVVVNPGDIIELAILEDDPIIENVPYTMIQNAPVFKGCEGLSKAENKVCFDKKMKRFVQRNFDAGLANELGLNAGKYKIRTQFIIDEKGNVIDIKIRAPHRQLEKETSRLIKKLPQFTPGQQQNRFVRVRYTLPIAFSVE